MLNEITPMIKKLIDAQVQNDRQTGAVGLDEAGCVALVLSPDQIRKISPASQDRIVAIFGLINNLQEEILGIAQIDYPEAPTY